MKTNRRDFLSSAALMGAGSAMIPLSSCSSESPSKSSVVNYTELDRVLAEPVLKRELLQDRKNFSLAILEEFRECWMSGSVMTPIRCL